MVLVLVVAVAVAVAAAPPVAVVAVVAAAAVESLGGTCTGGGGGARRGRATQFRKTNTRQPGGDGATTVSIQHVEQLLQVLQAATGSGLHEQSSDVRAIGDSPEQGPSPKPSLPTARRAGSLIAGRLRFKTTVIARGLNLSSLKCTIQHV